MREKNIGKMIWTGGGFLCFLLLLLCIGTAAVYGAPQGTLQASLDQDQSTCTISWSGYQMPSDGQALKVAVWSAENGQDDIRWRELSSVNGIYSVKFSVSTHGSYGLFHAHLYLQKKNGSMVFLADDTFTVTKVSCKSIYAADMNQSAGTCRLVIEGLSSTSGVSRVQVPTWSGPGQSNIIWYDAVQQPDGTWTADIQFSRHGSRTGTYYFHVYVTSKNGQFTFIGSTTAEYAGAAQEPAISAEVKGISCNLKVTGLKESENFRKVSFAVWSSTDGQDDLKWSSVSCTGGTAAKTIQLKDYCDYGTYNCHVYGVTASGKQKFVGYITFEVPYPSVEKLEAAADGDRFTVTVSGISCVSGIDRVIVPVWSRQDQSDIVWYRAEKQTDGSYRVASDLSRHKNNTGKFSVHVYVYDDRDSYGHFTGGTTLEFLGTAGELTVTADQERSVCRLSVENVSVPKDTSSVLMAVWSQKNGQDDIAWYTMKKNGSVWNADLLPDKHNRESGQ